VAITFFLVSNGHGRLIRQNDRIGRDKSRRLANTAAWSPTGRANPHVVLILGAVLFSSFVRFTADTFKDRISESLPASSTPQSRRENGASIAGQYGDPVVVDLSTLFAIPDDEQFLREAYQRVFGRECDPLGFIHFREMLRSHAPRQVVLSHLISSDEARQSGRRFSGLPDAKLLPGNWAYQGKGLLRYAQRAVSSRVRGLLHAVLQATRIEHLEHKVDYLVQELEARSDQISSKGDQSLWTLSEKLDAYTGTVLQKQSYIHSDITGQYRQLDETARELRETLETLSRGMQEALRKSRDEITQISGQNDTRMARIEAGAADTQGAVSRLSAGFLQQADSLQLIREEFGTAMEAQNRLHEKMAGSIDTISEAATQASAILNDVLKRQAAVELQQTQLHKQLETLPKPPVVFQGGNNVLVSELDGFIVGVPGEEWRMAAYHAFRGPMEPGLLRAFQRAVKPGSVVLDIGANIGVFTLHALRLTGLHGKVYSFEPAPRVFEILKDNVQVNGYLETGVIEFRQAAAWDRAGVAPMTIYEADSGRSTLFPDNRQGQEIEVITVTLDEAMSAQTRVDVVKIDAEGAEPRVLHGMRRIIERNPEIVIFIEFAPVHLRRAGVEPASFLDEIASMGLSTRQVDDVTGELRQIDREQILGCFSANLSLSRMEG